MNLEDHRRRQNRTATGTAALIATLGAAGALSPLVEQAVTVALAVLAGLAMLVGLARNIARRGRERREDAADALTTITWRAQHLPADHPLVSRDDRHVTAHTDRAGVA